MFFSCGYYMLIIGSFSNILWYNIMMHDCIVEKLILFWHILTVFLIYYNLLIIFHCITKLIWQLNVLTFYHSRMFWLYVIVYRSDDISDAWNCVYICLQRSDKWQSVMIHYLVLWINTGSWFQNIRIKWAKFHALHNSVFQPFCIFRWWWTIK